jgi:CheY-like chemotaxis protein
VARILVGEDEPVVRGLITLMLELEGHAVTAVSDGEAAHAALCAEAFDAAILDVRMDKLSGLEALERAALAGHPVRALVLTGDEDDELVSAAAQRLSARLRAKPIARADLMAEVNALLAAGSKS